MQTRQLSIDFDIHRAIEKNRRGFEDTDNNVLRRLLGLGSPPATAHPGNTGQAHSGIEVQQTNGRSWRGKGVELPEGTELRLVHPNVHASGRIRHGEWNVEGEKFNTPSHAVCSIVSKTLGREISLNGWKHWDIKRPNDSRFIPINSLRDQMTIERRQR